MSIKELEHRYRTAQEPNEGTWWQIWWLPAQGNTVTELPKVIGVSGFTVGETVTAIGQASFAEYCLVAAEHCHTACR